MLYSLITIFTSLVYSPVAQAFSCWVQPDWAEAPAYMVEVSGIKESTENDQKDFIIDTDVKLIRVYNGDIERIQQIEHLQFSFNDKKIAQEFKLWAIGLRLVLFIWPEETQIYSLIVFKDHIINRNRIDMFFNIPFNRCPSNRSQIISIYTDDQWQILHAKQNKNQGAGGLMERLFERPPNTQTIDQEHPPIWVKE